MTASPCKDATISAIAQFAVDLEGEPIHLLTPDTVLTVHPRSLLILQIQIMRSAMRSIKTSDPQVRFATWADGVRRVAEA